MQFGDLYDPADTWAAWIGHNYPSIGPAQMAGLTFAQIVDMYEFATRNSGG